MGCRGNCTRYEKYVKFWYILGYKKCTTCTVFLKDMIRCPCCNNLLQVKPRQTKVKIANRLVER